MKWPFPLMIIFVAIAFQVSGQEVTVNTTDWIVNGFNFDVDVKNGKIFIISDKYHELDLDGNITYSNTNIEDTGQGTLDFGPALVVGPGGEVHVLNRNGGNAPNGFNLYYSKREPNGTWSVENNLVGSPVARNYVVDIIALDSGEAVYAHSELGDGDVGGPVHFYRLNGTGSSYLQNLGTNSLYRVDADFRMEQYQDRLHIATGKPDPYGIVYYMNADIGPTLGPDLASSAEGYSGDDNRRGGPDVQIDEAGDIFIAYGDVYEILFERISFDGNSDISHMSIMDNLGSWHLNFGMPALGISPTGDTLLMIGLQTGGDAELASSCTIKYKYSLDGGFTWSATDEIASKRTHSGEGRARPRVHYYNHKFYVFYNDTDGGISLTTIQIGEGPPPPPPPELVDPVDLSLNQLATGNNFDVEVANDRIYLLSDHYYEYNLAGEKYNENSGIDDTGQGIYDFGPALAIGAEGEVHLVTRNGGNGSDGFSLKYSRRDTSGTWDVVESPMGTVMPRNYVVDVVALDGGMALAAHGSFQEGDGFGNLFFYQLDSSQVTSWGDLGRNDLYKVNSDFRMERHMNTLHLVSGKPYENGTVYYMKGFVEPSLTSELTAGIVARNAGPGISGQPDLRLDAQGDVRMIYGSDQTALFNSITGGGAVEVVDKPIMDGLGSWKLNLGLSAIECDSSGDTLLAVGLKTDGSVSASSCTLYYTWSMDGGENWVYPVELTGFTTDGGEGRMRPRVRHYMGRFYLFFNNGSGGISVKTIKLPADTADLASDPVILPAGDSITAQDLITIGSPGSDAIYYSYADSTPDMLSIRYTEGFNLWRDTTIFAIAYRRGYLPSNVTMAVKKFKGEPPPPPAVLVDPVDLSIGNLAGGKNFDVTVANRRIYMISDHYYEFNLAGTLISENPMVEDSAQGTYEFGPAIDVGWDSMVHVITRYTGNVDGGFELNYSRKPTGGNWTHINHKVGIRLPRNYVVDVVARENGEALYAHSAQTTGDVWGSVYFYELNGTNQHLLGAFGRDDLYRIDADFRMERFGNRLHIATGKPDPDGAVYYMNADMGSSLPTTLAADPKSLVSGTGRRGQPDLRVDGAGNTCITYGSDQTVWFRKYTPGGSVSINDTPLFSQLGTWHLGLGLSALAVSPGGDTLMALALKTDGTKESFNSTIYYSWSVDGGQNWTYPATLSGYTTSAGEGRMRPRVHYYLGRFYIFFNNVNGGIGVKTVNVSGSAPMKATPPVILPARDTVMIWDEITLQSPGADAIFYSLNGVPDLHSTRYTGPFTLESDAIIRAIAYREGYLPSDMVASTKYLDKGPPLVDPVDITLSRIAGGTNFDVEVAHDRIYLISDHYYEFDLAGNLLTENTLVEDLGQDTYDFGPAIAVDKKGVVHTITRGNGNGTEGFELQYSKKDYTGIWVVENHSLGSPVARNYVVDVIPLEDGKALFAHSGQTTEDVWSSVYFYELNGASVAPMGDFQRDDLYRIDADFRMERFQDEIHLATGKPDPEGVVYYMHSPLGSSLPLDLASSPSAFTGGEGRRGQPDLVVDKSGHVIVTYGAEQAVLFSRYSEGGEAEVMDKPILSRLGSWHLDLGISALASTTNGDTLLAVGLKTDDSEGASFCTLHVTYSFDGGQNWVYRSDLNVFHTNGGEGRMRPRVKFYRGRFYLFLNNIAGGIAVTTIDLRNATLLTATNPVIIPSTSNVFTHDPILISAAGSEAIFYSFSDPEAGLLSTLYDGPFNLAEDETIYARSYRSGYLPSDVVMAEKHVLNTSVEEESNREGERLILYPVPAGRTLQLRSESDFSGEVTIKVFNHAGKLMLMGRVDKKERTLRHELNVGSWPAGLYILTMQAGNTASSRTFVIR